MPAAHRP